MMTASIPAEFEPFVRDEVAQGRYTSTEEVLRKALSLLRGEQKLREEIALGIAEADRGETIPADEIYAYLRQRIADVASGKP